MIQITTDSTCDLGPNAAERGISIMPLSVILGEDSYRDGVDITPQDIFDFVEKTGKLPKTAAPSISDYEEFFGKYVREGKTVIHFNISAKSSSSNLYAEKAAQQFGGKVFVVDTKALSSGQGLVVMKACDLAYKGQPRLFQGVGKGCAAASRAVFRKLPKPVLRKRRLICRHTLPRVGRKPV